MVNPQLVDQTKRVLGDRRRSILVTGGTGFVGSHLASCLAEAGNDVTVIGRNKYRTNRINHPNIRFAKADIRDKPAVGNACAGQEFVYHVAAMTAPWGKWSLFEQNNVQGSRNVVEGCLEHAVSRLVHISSTSIFFDYSDLKNHSDRSPAAIPQACNYSESKRQAEEIINSATQHGLNAFTIRARAVFGDGDTTLLPRLITAARDGRLRQIGDGQNWVDLTYIDNLTWALVLAMEQGRSGGVCTITNDQPVKLWEFLPSVFEKLEVPYHPRSVPYNFVHAAVACNEALHRTLPFLGEPKLTCYTAGLLAKNQVFSLDAATSELGYEPIVSMSEGVDRTLDSLKQSDSEHAKASVEIQYFTTGYVSGDRRFVERSTPSQQTRFHTMVALLKHPTFGLTLFDTGYAPRLTGQPGISHRLYNSLLPVHTNDRLSIANQLRQIGIEPGDIKRIVISHFHPDHIAGLLDFPDSEFIASQTAWYSVRNRRGLRALRYAYLPQLVPDDFTERLHLIETYSNPGMGPFDGSHDLFGDGSIRLFDLPGHAAGQMGALVQTAERIRDFLVADAAWTSAAIRQKIMPHWATRSFVYSFREIHKTLVKLNLFFTQYPDINIIPTHCPEVADRFAFDGSISKNMSRGEA